MEKAKKAKLTEGKIGTTLLKLAIPMFIGILSMIAFNLVDTFFVAQLGTNELAAMSFTFPVIMVIGSLAMGLGIGTSALVSRAIGEGNSDKVKRLTTDGLVLAVLVVIVGVIVGILTIDPLFRALGATPEVLVHIRSYITIWYLGVVFVVVPMVGNSIIRATGDTKTPSLIMLLVVIVNTIMDPLLIFGIGPFPRLELVGAAIATVIARAITLVVAIWVLAVREKMITFEPPKLDFVLKSWRQILYIGIPSAASQMIIPVSIAIITAMVAAYGPSAVAGFGVASRIDIFALAVTIALGAVLSPFVGQNWGAGLKQRVDIAVTHSFRFTVGWGLLVFLVFIVAGRPVAALFSDNPDVIATIVLYLAMVPLSYAFQGMLNLANSVLNVLQKPLHAAALTAVQMFVLLIPLAYIGSSLFGLVGIFGAIIVANTIAGIGGYFVLRRAIEDVTWETSTRATPQAGVALSAESQESPA